MTRSYVRTVAGTPIIRDLPDAPVQTADIADDAVTYAKMQNVSASPRLLGRRTAGAGNTEELTPDQVNALLAGAAKVLLTFTWVAGVPTIITSFNVASLTDTGAGVVTVNLTTPFSTSDYIVVLGFTTFNAGAQQQYDVLYANNTTSSFQLRYFNNGVLTDNTAPCMCAAFGSQ